MTTDLPAFLPASAEIFVLFMACVTMLTSVFTKKKSSNISFYLTEVALAGAAWLTWSSYTGEPSYAFFDSFVLDRLAVVLKLFICLISFMVFAYSRYYVRDRQMAFSENYILGLLAVLGMMTMVSGNNLLVLYLGLELMSLPIYAMVALQRQNARCVEAAMKYFVIGALASGMLLYGMSMIFGATRSLDLATIYQVVLHMPAAMSMLLVFGLVFILAGLAFKLGAAPFHMWVPDVYDGAPTSVTLFIATAPKLAAFGLVVRLLVYAMPSLSVQWSHVLVVMSLMSMGIGNVFAISQSNIKRMLAYSSIAHMGYMLLGLACATPDGESAALFYMVAYTIMTMAAFAMIILISEKGDVNSIEDFAGLNHRNPWLAFMLLIVMFSMAGIPPIVGFMAKLSVLEALIQVHMVWLAVVALLFAIIGSYYYIRVVKVMYFDEPTTDVKLVCPRDLQVAISVNGLAVLVLGVFPGFLFTMSHLVF